MYANNVGESKQPSRNPTGKIILYLFYPIILSFKEDYFSVTPEYHAQAQEVAQVHPLRHKPFENMQQINKIYASASLPMSLILISWVRGKQ